MNLRSTIIDVQETKLVLLWQTIAYLDRYRVLVPSTPEDAAAEAVVPTDDSRAITPEVEDDRHMALMNKLRDEVTLLVLANRFATIASAYRAFTNTVNIQLLVFMYI